MDNETHNDKKILKEKKYVTIIVYKRNWGFRACRDNKISNLEYNVLLGLIKETEQYALKDCEEIEKEVTDMVANLIDLKC